MTSAPNKRRRHYKIGAGAGAGGRGLPDTMSVWRVEVFGLRWAVRDLGTGSRCCHPVGYIVADFLIHETFVF